MKRLLSIVIFLVLLVMLFQMNTEISFADTTYPVVYVGGVALSDGEYLESGSSTAVTFQPLDNYAHYSNGVLSLYNYSYDGMGYKVNAFRYYAGIYADGNLTVNLMGNNSISTNGGAFSMGIYTTGDLNISGNGKITVNADHTGIVSDNNIMFTRGDIVVVSELAISAINNVIVTAASVDAKSIVSDGISDEACCAITCVNGSLELSSSVTVTASEDPNETTGEYDESKLSDYDRIIIKSALSELSFVGSNSFDIGPNKVGTPIQSFSVALGVSGGIAPYTFNKVSGPDWLAVANDGLVSGTPTTEGDNAPLVVRVTDNAGQNKEISIAVGKTESNTYKISFDANGGSSSMTDVNVSGEYTLPESGFTAPEGMRFKCWSIDGVEKNVGDTIIVSSGITLKAIWEAMPIPDIWVGGVGMFDGDYLANGAPATTKAQPISGGYAYYNNGVLTLCGYSYTGKGYYFTGASNGYAAIYSTIDLAIVCINATDNTLIVQGDDNCNGIVSMSDVLIRGNGSLSVTATYHAISVDGDLTINAIGFTALSKQSVKVENISITTSEPVSITSTNDHGINAQGDVYIYAPEFTVTSDLHSIHSGGKVDLSGETLIFTSTRGSGIYALSGDTTITTKNVIITGMTGLTCDSITVNSDIVELKSTLNYNHAVIAYHYVNISADDISIDSNGDGIFSYENITIECDNLEIYCSHNTALRSIDETVKVTAETIDIVADCCVEADEVIILATGDIDLSANTSYGIHFDSDAQIIAKNVNIEAQSTAIYSTSGELTINASNDVSIITESNSPVANCKIIVAAKTFFMAGKTSDDDIVYEFVNQYDEDYAVFSGNTVDDLIHKCIISPNTTYTGEMNTNVIKIVKLNHSLSGWLHNDTHHWKDCSCGLKYEENIHYGGTATCKEKAVCDVCGEEHGNYADHEYGDLIPAVSEKHTSTELAPSVDAHYYCDVCEKYFTESKEETTLVELTGQTPSHNFEQKHNDKKHWDECSCGLKQNEELHYGGTATCKEKAVCDVCGEEYGDFADHEYGELTPAVDEKHTQTELEPSIDAYYYCDICNKYFTEEMVETTWDELTGDDPIHLPGDWQANDNVHWKECECGMISQEDEHVDSDRDGLCDLCEYEMIIEDPELGENTLLYYVVFIISIIGIAVTFTSKRKKVY